MTRGILRSGVPKNACSLAFGILRRQRKQERSGWRDRNEDSWPVHDRSREGDPPARFGIHFLDVHRRRRSVDTREIKHLSNTIPSALGRVPAKPHEWHRDVLGHREGRQQVGMREKISERAVPQSTGRGGLEFEHGLTEHTEIPGVGSLDHSKNIQKKPDAAVALSAECGCGARLETTGEVIHHALGTPVHIGTPTADVLAEDRNHRCGMWGVISDFQHGIRIDVKKTPRIRAFQIVLDEVSGPF